MMVHIMQPFKFIPSFAFNLKPVFLFFPLPRGKPAIFRAELGKKLIN